MSYKGLDFNGDGHVSRTESHMTYNIIREGTKKSSNSSSSSYRSTVRNSTSSAAQSKQTTEIKKPRYKYTRFAIFISIVFLIGVPLIHQAILEYNQMVKSYKRAIEEIKDGDYHWALRYLEELKDKNYKDSEYLYYYAQSLNTDNQYIAAQHLEKIPDDYSGIFSHDIALEKINYIERCETEKKLKADKELAEREAEEQFKAKLSKGLPYEGMSVKYIKDTIIGTYDEHNLRESPGNKWDEYIWYSEDYKKMMVFLAWADNGVVFRVEKHGQPDYWIDNKYPNFKGGTTHSKGKIYSDEEKYDISRFYHAEDFYDFYYDEFRDFDEAEEFFEKHKNK